MSNLKESAYNFLNFIEILKLVRIITISNIIFKKKYKSRLEYCLNKLKMSEKEAIIVSYSEE